MTTVPPKQRDWLEPPDWWKKWRPLRWLAGLLMLIAVLSWVQPLFAPGETDGQDEPPIAEAPEPALAIETDEDPDGERALVADAVLEPATSQTQAAAPAAEVTPSAKLAATQAKPSVAAPAAVAPTKAAETAKAEPRPAEKGPEAAAPAAPAPGATSATEAQRPAPAPAPAPAAAAPATPAVDDDEADQAQAASDYRAYTERQPNPVVLMTAFRSYSSVDAVHGALKTAQYEPIQESNHSKVRAGVPPRNLDLMRVKGYRHLGVSGVLELQFFNDRLTQAEFQPDATEVQVYRDALRRVLPQLPRERSGRSELREGQLRVASSLDLALSEVGAALRTRPFVLWQDLRLIEQRDSWDQRFGTQAN